MPAIRIDLKPIRQVGTPDVSLGADRDPTAAQFGALIDTGVGALAAVRAKQVENQRKAERQQRIDDNYRMQTGFNEIDAESRGLSKAIDNLNNDEDIDAARVRLGELSQRAAQNVNDAKPEDREHAKNMAAITAEKLVDIEGSITDRRNVLSNQRSLDSANEVYKSLESFDQIDGVRARANSFRPGYSGTDVEWKNHLQQSEVAGLSNLLIRERHEPGGPDRIREAHENGLFSGLSGELQARILDDANRAEAQQHEVSVNSLLRESLLLGTHGLDNDDQLFDDIADFQLDLHTKLEDIEKSSGVVLDASAKDELRRKLERAEIQAVALEDQFSAGMGVIGGVRKGSVITQSDVDAANLYAERSPNLKTIIQQGTPDQVATLYLETVRNATFVPNFMANAMNGMVLGNSVDGIEKARLISDAINQEFPAFARTARISTPGVEVSPQERFEAQMGVVQYHKMMTPEAQALLDEYSANVAAGNSPSEALTAAKDRDRPEAKKMDERFTEDLKRLSGSKAPQWQYIEDGITSHFDTWGFDAAVDPMMTLEAERVARNYFRLNPDMDKAISYASRELLTQWGRDQDGVWVKRPPEIVKNDATGWTYQQLEFDAAKDGITIDGQPIARDSVRLRNMGRKNGEDQYAVMQIVKDKDGFEDLKFALQKDGTPWRWTPGSAETSEAARQQRLRDSESELKSLDLQIEASRESLVKQTGDESARKVMDKLNALRKRREELDAKLNEKRREDEEVRKGAPPRTNRTPALKDRISEEARIMGTFP